MYPFLKLTETLHLPTYPLLISLALCLAAAFAYQRARRFTEKPVIALDVSLIAIGLGLLGARLFHIVYEQPLYYLENPWDTLKVWQGGFVFFGGFLAAMAGVFWFLLRQNLSFWRWADIFAPATALGYGTGRIGCFLNGCCYGAACQWPWGVEFVAHSQYEMDLISRHPTQLYASAGAFLTALILLRLEKRLGFGNPFPGFLFLVWLTLHSLARLFMEALRADERGPAILELSVSSWIALLLTGLALTGLLHKARKACLNR